jgi:hypothetical protein
VRPAKTLFGDPARGSYLATYWLLPDAQATWDEWVQATYASMPPERLFSGRDHVHTAVYRYLWELRTEDAPPPATALDHGFDGVIVIASLAPGDWVKQWARSVLTNRMNLVVAFASKSTIMSDTAPDDHVLLLGFCRDDPLAVWRDVVEPKLDQAPGLGYAGPFVRTVPGTDRYTDDL